MGFRAIVRIAVARQRYEGVTVDPCSGHALTIEPTGNWKDAMAFVPFNNTIKIEPIFVWDGQRVQNVHYYLVDEFPDLTTAQDLAEAYIAWWDAGMKARTPTNLQLVMVVATIMEEENSPGLEVTTGLPLTGNNASPSLPNNVSVAVKWNTAFRGRSYRGRTYHIGLVEFVVTGNTIDTGYATDLQTLYTDLLVLDTDVGPARMGVASKISNGAFRTVGVITPVESVTVDRTVDSQRRRLPGRGR